MTFIFDLAVHTAQPGRSREIERYARAYPPIPESDDARLLAAIQRARFSLWQIEGRHETAGLLLTDIIRGESVWLMDEDLEESAAERMIFGARVFETSDGFSMTCGLAVALNEMMFKAMFDMYKIMATRTPEDFVGDRRFAMALYNQSISMGQFEGFDLDAA